MLLVLAKSLNLSVAPLLASGWVLKGLIVGAALYAALFGLAIAGYRTLYLKCRTRGPPMTAIRTHAWGSLLLALLIAMLLAVAVGGAAARADAPAAVADRAAAAPAPQSDWSEDSHPADGVRDRADERDEDSADAASDSDEGRNRNDIEEYFDWGHGWQRQLGKRRHRRASHGDELVNFGRDSDLPAGRACGRGRVDLRLLESEGDADDVVSILGDTRTSGRVSDSAVAVVGNAYIDGPVGATWLRCSATSISGRTRTWAAMSPRSAAAVIRDPAAVVRGDVQSVGGLSAGFGGCGPGSIIACSMAGRWRLVPGIGWAWALALAFLALYVVPGASLPRRGIALREHGRDAARHDLRGGVADAYCSHRS